MTSVAWSSATSLALTTCLLASSGCSSHAEGSTPQGTATASSCKISGTYKVVSKPTGGTCPNLAEDTSTLSITTSGTTATLVYQGINGDCPDNKIDGCKLNVVCRFNDKAGRQIAASQASFTFDSKGFSGPEADAITDKVPLDDGGTIGPCTGNYDVTGIRQ